MSKTLAWGILGTGTIARIFTKGLTDSKTGTLVAVGSRTQEAADAFGDEWKVAHRHGSYEQLLADPAVEGVYTATPHPLDAQWGIKAAEAVKHMLCERPLRLSHV